MTEKSRIERIARLELAIRYAVKALRRGDPKLAQEILEKELAWSGLSPAP